ncbi:MAG: hypothetical protein KDK66_07635 [Deltaproteobacteria bacterium]|nr:hypothetical protein [Deltaproteobacteria bacterium]
MPKSKPTRLYFKNNNQTGYKPLVSFHEYDKHHMHIYFYGLKRKQAKLIGEFPDQIEAYSKKSEYQWKGLIPINKDLEYISIHEKGMHFSIKLKGERAHKLTASQDISSASSTFLKFTIISDCPSQYTFETENAKDPYCCLPHKEDHRFCIDGTFSGKEYPLVESALPLKGGEIILNGGYLKGLLVPSPINHPYKDWPSGTLILFYFATENQKRLIKALLIG